MVRAAAFFISLRRTAKSHGTGIILGKKTSPHSLRRRMGGSLIDRTGFPAKPLGFARAPDQTQMGRRSPPISRFCPLSKTLGRAIRRGRGAGYFTPLSRILPDFWAYRYRTLFAAPRSRQTAAKAQRPERAGEWGGCPAPRWWSRRSFPSSPGRSRW